MSADCCDGLSEQPETFPFLVVVDSGKDVVTAVDGAVGVRSNAAVLCDGESLGCPPDGTCSWRAARWMALWGGEW